MASVENNLLEILSRKLFGVQKEVADNYFRGLFGGIAKFIFGEDVIVICDHSIVGGKKETIYKVVPRNNCVEKYGAEVERFIPESTLDTSVLVNLDLKKLVS